MPRHLPIHFFFVLLKFKVWRNDMNLRNIAAQIKETSRFSFFCEMFVLTSAFFGQRFLK